MHRRQVVHVDIRRKLIGCCVRCGRFLSFVLADSTLMIRDGALGPVCADCEKQIPANRLAHGLCMVIDFTTAARLDPDVSLQAMKLLESNRRPPAEATS